MPYLSQISYSWGPTYFTELSREFHTYFALWLFEFMRDAERADFQSNKWRRSWSNYLIDRELVYLCRYPEVGSHVKHVSLEAYLRREAIPPAADELAGPSACWDRTMDLPNRSLPSYSLLPTLHLCLRAT
ncbi:hypothetical protein WOLCODRAFT_157959 [Wolfiporia cocos MD-104 SS10]|uniref:Uncharacterized protein n=1 Tax=Wolfiporia cocos (strain MD-104) TaxID=742152 RepID=A0A2H3JKS8_WOLCO|nr:hypothetical protein WOLCODRAFT_157959 [Wolfiporia cocos MD-104 SS10]